MSVGEMWVAIYSKACLIVHSKCMHRGFGIILAYRQFYRHTNKTEQIEAKWKRDKIHTQMEEILTRFETSTKKMYLHRLKSRRVLREIRNYLYRGLFDFKDTSFFLPELLLPLFTLHVNIYIWKTVIVVSLVCCYVEWNHGKRYWIEKLAPEYCSMTADDDDK